MKFCLTTVLLSAALLAPHTSAITNSHVPVEYSLPVFADDFDGTELDSTKWKLSPGTWLFPEATRPELQQVYRGQPGNVAVENGHLLLKTLKQDVTDDGVPDWTSGAVRADYLSKQRFGYFESRFKVTAAPKQNNAFWLGVGAPVHNHGTESWEFDICENGYPTRQTSNWYNHNKDNVEGHKSLTETELASLGLIDLSAQYVTYGCEWATDHTIKIYLNGTLIHTFGDSGQLTDGGAMTHLTAGYWGNAASAFGLEPNASAGASISGSIGRYATGPNGTISFLFKTPPVLSGWATLFNQGQYGSASQLEVGINNNQLRLGTQNGTINQLNTLGVLETNTWYWLCLRWDLAATSENMLWAYGVAGDTTLNSGSTTITSAGNQEPVFVGGRSTYAPFINGFFQHITVYERTLSGAAAQAMFDATAVSATEYESQVGSPTDGGNGPALWYTTARTPNLGSAGSGPEFQAAEALRGAHIIFSTLPFLNSIDALLNNGTWTTNDLEALHGTAMDVDWVQSWQKPGWIGTNTDWSQSANWGADGVPGAGEAAVFNQSISQTNIALNRDTAVQELSFQSTHIPAMTLSGPGTLKLGTLKPGANLGVGGIGMTFNVLESQTINAPIEAQRKVRFINLAGAPEELGGPTEGLGAQLTLNGPISALETNTPIDFFNLGDIVVNGAIDSRIGTIVKDSQGLLELNAANAFSGELALRDGIVLVNADGALGSTHEPTVIYPHTYQGSLVFGTVDYTQPEPIILHGAGANNRGFETRAGAIDVMGVSTASFAGPISLGSDATIGCKESGAVLHLSGGVSLETNTLTLAGNGTIVLDSAVSGSGSIVVEGELGFSEAGSIDIGGVLDLSGATLNFSSGTFTNSAHILATAASITGTPTLSTPLPAGYTLDSAYSGEIQLALIQIAPYEEWRNVYFPGNPDDAVAGPNGDPDFDNASNLSEFAFGTNPTNPGDRALSSLYSTNLFRVLFLRRVDGSLAYTVRTSTNLTEGFHGTSPFQVPANQPAELPENYEQVETLITTHTHPIFVKIDAETVK